MSFLYFFYIKLITFFKILRKVHNLIAQIISLNQESTNTTVHGPIQAHHLLLYGLQAKDSFYILKWFLKIKRRIWHIKIIWNSNFRVIKFSWNTAVLASLCRGAAFTLRPQSEQPGTNGCGLTSPALIWDERKPRNYFEKLERGQLSRQPESNTRVP